MSKSSGNSVESLLGEFQKKFGDTVGSTGDKFPDLERVPTGIFPFDLATGGGFPRNKLSIVYGPESSNKTNLALKAIAQHQQMWPKLKCSFFDIENGFDPVWASKLGVNVKDLFVFRPDYAEQAVDIMEGLIHAEDCGLAVLDSIPALITNQEAESFADKANVGGNALVIGKLIRKVNSGLTQSLKNGTGATVIMINQIRTKIGVMFGNPEDMPGGFAPKYASAMTIRTFGKNVMDTKVSDTIPVVKETKVVVRKWKCPIVSTQCQFNMCTYPYKGMSPGDIDDWPTMKKYLEDYNLLSKGEKGGWKLVDDDYKTLKEVQERLYNDKEYGRLVRKAIIEVVQEDALKKNQNLVEGGSDD